MNDVQFKCFLAAAKYENFTKAAETMYLSQPVVGRHISNLEEELGVMLFVRDRKTVKLTENGKLFEKFVRETFSNYESVMERIQNNIRGQSMNLVIGSAEGQQIGDFYSSAFRYIVDNQPSLTVSVSFYLNHLLIEALKSGAIDAAIMDMDDANTMTDIVDFKKVKYVRSCLIIPNTHPMAAKRVVTVNDFANDRFILLSAEDSELTKELQMNSMNQLGITNYIEAPNISTFSALAEAGVGVTTVPENHKLCCSPNLVCIDIPEISITLTEVFAWNKNNKNPAIKAFCDILDKTGYSIED